MSIHRFTAYSLNIYLTKIFQKYFNRLNIETYVIYNKNFLSFFKRVVDHIMDLTLYII